MSMLNLASLPKHIEEIRVLLADQCFDILALNERRLGNNITNLDMHIDNYSLISSDRSRKGGGVCIYVKNSITFSERKDLIKDNVESVFIEIHQPSSASFIVGTIYRPPSASFDSFSAIEQLVKLMDNEDKEFYLLGDLNVNILNNSNNGTMHLFSIMEQYQTITSPTRMTITSSSLLDVCITSTPERLIVSRVVPIAISDHYMIIVVRKINAYSKQNRHKKIEFRNFKYFNANRFQTDLLTQEWELLDNQASVDKMWHVCMENSFYVST